MRDPAIPHFLLYSCLATAHGHCRCLLHSRPGSGNRGDDGATIRSLGCAGLPFDLSHWLRSTNDGGSYVMPWARRWSSPFDVRNSRGRPPCAPGGWNASRVGKSSKVLAKVSPHPGNGFAAHDVIGIEHVLHTLNPGHAPQRARNAKKGQDRDPAPQAWRGGYCSGVAVVLFAIFCRCSVMRLISCVRICSAFACCSEVSTWV